MVTLENIANTCRKILEKPGGITSGELIFLLDGRRKNLVDFLLIDIREPEEHKNLNINGTDMLFSVSKMSLYPEVVEGLRHVDFILYCAKGQKSDFLLSVFKNMGYIRGTKLKGGILDFTGNVRHSDEPPNIF